MKDNIKMNTPPEMHDDTFVIYGNSSKINRSLGIVNTKTGYVFLIDGNGEVRWKASGMATQREIETLNNLTRKLLNMENERRKNAGPKIIKVAGK